MKLKKGLLALPIFVLFISGCGPKAYVRGDYDTDVNQTNLLNDKWSESDMQNAVRDLVASATNHYAISSAKRPPIVMVTVLENKTDEHIETESVMDMVRVELSRGGRVAFVDKAARDDIKKEYDYQGSGMVNRETQKSAGGQIGADFIINGRIDSIVQQAGRDKSVYYKITLNMTNWNLK